MEQIYTIFYVHGPSYSSVAFDAGSIEEALEHFTAGYGGRYLPVAWCTERTASHGGTRLTGELRLEAMAEGRTFYYDFAKDMYVAVGNEPPKTVIKRAPLPHFNQRTDFDNFEGFDVHGTTSVDAAAIHPLQRISSMSHMLGNGIKG